MLVLTLFSKLSFVIKSHFCPFLMEWNRFVLFLLLKNKQKTVFWEFLFQASQAQKKRGHLFCIFAVQRNQNPYDSSPFENFSWTQLSHIFFFQQTPIFRVVLLLTGIGLCCWTNQCGNEQGIFFFNSPFSLKLGLESVQFSHSVVSDSLQPHGLQHAVRDGLIGISSP